MEDMRVYIANLGKYNEGELVGAWFQLPVDEDEMAERIGLNEHYEEYAIHDYELPFEIDEYTSLDELNTLYEKAQTIEGTPLAEVAREVQQAFFSSFEEFIDHADDVVCHTECTDMEDLAYQMVNEGLLGEASETFVRYFDYASYARDLELDGNFVVTKRGVFEYPN